MPIRPRHDPSHASDARRTGDSATDYRGICLNTRHNRRHTLCLGGLIRADHRPGPSCHKLDRSWLISAGAAPRSSLRRHIKLRLTNDDPPSPRDIQLSRSRESDAPDDPWKRSERFDPWRFVRHADRKRDLRWRPRTAENRIRERFENGQRVERAEPALNVPGLSFCAAGMRAGACMKATIARRARRYEPDKRDRDREDEDCSKRSIRKIPGVVCHHRPCAKSNDHRLSYLK